MASTDWEYQKRLKKENERRERELAKRERELAEREKEHQRRQEAARIAERERQAARRSTYQDREQRQSRYRPRDRDDFYEYGDEGYIDLPYPEPAYGGRHEPPRYREGPRRPQATREHSSGNSRAMIPQMQTKQPGRREEMSMMAPNGGNATKEFDEKRIEQAGVGHRNEFSHGLFKCFDEPGLCCYAWCCSCFHHGETTARLDSLAQTGRPAKTSNFTIDKNCGLYFALLSCTGLGAAYCSCVQRGQVRARYGIEGSEGKDALITCCCFPCTLVQASREVGEEERELLGNRR